MEIMTKKKGGKAFMFDEPPIQVGGGVEDTMMAPCRTRGCKNSFEQPFPEPGESMTNFCPDCMEEWALRQEAWKRG